MTMATKAAIRVRPFLLTLAGVMLISSQAWGQIESTLKLPVKAELLVLDGKNANDLNLAKGKPVKLTKKRHQIVFQLEDTIGSGNNVERFKSSPFVIAFHPIDGHKYTITAPGILNTRQGDAINKNPTSKISLVNEKAEEIPFEMAVLPSKGVQIGRNYAIDVRKFNLTDNEAALPELAEIKTMTGINGFANAQQDPTIYSGAEDNTPEENIMAERMLKHWYQEADSETRKKFLNWTKTLKQP